MAPPPAPRDDTVVLDMKDFPLEVGDHLVRFLGFVKFIDFVDYIRVDLQHDNSRYIKDLLFDCDDRGDNDSRTY